MKKNSRPVVTGDFGLNLQTRDSVWMSPPQDPLSSARWCGRGHERFDGLCVARQATERWCIHKLCVERDCAESQSQQYRWLALTSNLLRLVLRTQPRSWLTAKFTDNLWTH